ncbi:hypothetical protein Trydic_g11170 [Trypoxylus dichotomus]
MQGSSLFGDEIMFVVLGRFGDLNAQWIVQLYKKGLLTSVKVWFKSGTENWILQGDNDMSPKQTVSGLKVGKYHYNIGLAFAVPEC